MRYESPVLVAKRRAVNLIKGKPPAVPGDSQSLTFPGIYESPW